MDKDSVAKAVADALWPHAPECNRSGWYQDMAVKLDCHPNTVANVLAGQGCDITTYFKLATVLGPAFAAAVHKPLTGFHVSDEPSELAKRIEATGEALRAAQDTLSGVVPFKGKVS